MASSETRTDNDWLSLGQASELLGVHPATLRQWADEGKVGLFRTPGGHRRFARSEIERLLHVLPVRGAGLSAFVANTATQRTRQELMGQLQQPWMQQLDPAQRETWRQAGRQLVGLVAQLTNTAEVTAAQSAMAAELGRTYGIALARAGLELPNAVIAFLMFRDSLIETIFQLPSTTGFDREATLATLRRVNTVLNNVLQVVMQSFMAERGT